MKKIMVLTKVSSIPENILLLLALPHLLLASFPVKFGSFPLSVSIISLFLHLPPHLPLYFPPPSLMEWIRIKKVILMKKQYP